MICKNCGNNMADTDLFCMNCGASADGAGGAKKTCPFCGNQEPESSFSCSNNLWSRSKYFHSFVNWIYTRCNERACSFYFNNTYSTSTDLIKIFQIAKRRNFYSTLICSIQYCASFWNLNQFVINFLIHALEFTI